MILGETFCFFGFLTSKNSFFIFLRVSGLRIAAPFSSFFGVYNTFSGLDNLIFGLGYAGELVFISVAGLSGTTGKNFLTKESFALD